MPPRAVVICPVSAKVQPVECRRKDSAWNSMFGGVAVVTAAVSP